MLTRPIAKTDSTVEPKPLPDPPPDPPNDPIEPKPPPSDPPNDPIEPKPPSDPPSDSIGLKPPIDLPNVLTQPGGSHVRRTQHRGLPRPALKSP